MIRRINILLLVGLGAIVVLAAAARLRPTPPTLQLANPSTSTPASGAAPSHRSQPHPQLSRPTGLDRYATGKLDHHDPIAADPVLLARSAAAGKLLASARYREAEIEYTELTHAAPSSPLAYTSLAVSQHLQNHYADAERNNRHALDLHPRYAPALIGIGSIRFVQKRYPEALELFRHAVDAEPLTAEGYWGLAITSEAMGDYARALINYQRYVDLKDNTNMTNVNFASGRVRELRESLEKGSGAATSSELAEPRS